MINFSNIEKKKLELSTHTLKPALIYLEKKFGRKVVAQFVQETGLDIEYLDDGKNWVSFEYFNLFLKKLIEFTGNPNAPFESGKYLLSKESYGYIYAVLIIAKIFATPSFVYKKIFELSPTFTNIGRFELLSARKNRVVFQYKLFEGYKQTKLNCMSIKGQLAHVPCFWGLPRAKIKETKCAADGADACVYEFSWMLKPIRSIIFIIISFLVILAEVLLFFLLKPPILGIKDILITTLFLSLVAFALRSSKLKSYLMENQNLHEQRSKELERAAENSKKQYMKLQEANLQIVDKANKLSIINYIGEKINNIDEEDILLYQTIRIVIDFIRFDRGYFLQFDSDYEPTRNIVGFCRAKDNKIVENSLDNKKVKIPHINKLFEEGKPQIINSQLIFPLENDFKILIIPLQIQKTIYYLLAFDYYYSQKKIEEKNLQFFSTIQRHVEIALNKIYATKLARNVLSSMPSCIATFEKDTLNINYVNPTFLRNFNIEKNKVLGENIINFLKIPEDNRKLFKMQVKDTWAKITLGDLEFMTSSRVYGYTLFKMPRSISGKDEIGMIMKDITDQKRLQENLIREEKLAALGTLTSGVAHEINNPLYGILGTAEVIQDEARIDEIKDLAQEIIDFAMQCSDIVKDLSAYSRSIREEKPKGIDINSVMEETIKIISYSPMYINIEVEKHYSKIPAIVAIGGEIRQIYMNVINNAIQAMEGKGKLTLVSSLNDGYIVTQVEDTGPGIPEGIISKIFDPFFTTKPTGEGTGIGLNIVYRLVKKYHGIILVDSKTGKGTVFTIKFPVGV